MAEISLRKINKVYGDKFHAIQDLSFDIKDGEFMVFVGPSGCGKSTALRMIAGLESITSGDLLIGDKLVNDIDPKDRDIAMVFQSYALYPHKTVRENMAFPLQMARLDKAEIDRRVTEAARILELTPHLDRKPGKLSGGQRQRVAMGRAIVRKPAAFLMDEPLSNLDAKLRVQMRAEIAGLQRKLGVTTVYVTHDQVEAMTMGDRVAVLKAGVLQQVDTPQNLYARPVNVFCRGFHRVAVDEPVPRHSGWQYLAPGQSHHSVARGIVGGPAGPCRQYQPRRDSRHPARGHGRRAGFARPGADHRAGHSGRVPRLRGDGTHCDQCALGGWRRP